MSNVVHTSTPTIKLLKNSSIKFKEIDQYNGSVKSYMVSMYTNLVVSEEPFHIIDLFQLQYNRHSISFKQPNSRNVFTSHYFRNVYDFQHFDYKRYITSFIYHLIDITFYCKTSHYAAVNDFSDKYLDHINYYYAFVQEHYYPRYSFDMVYDRFYDSNLKYELKADPRLVFEVKKLPLLTQYRLDMYDKMLSWVDYLINDHGLENYAQAKYIYKIVLDSRKAQNKVQAIINKATNA